MKKLIFVLVVGVLAGAVYGLVSHRRGQAESATDLSTQRTMPAAAAKAGSAGGPAPIRPATPPSPPAAPAPSTAPADAGSDRAGYEAARASLERTIDRAWLDVKARGATIGTDPRAIWQFLQQDIGYEAYPGALRGARGTLLARAGNSLDRSLLEAELLQATGRKVRFATATLPGDKAEALVRSEFARPVPVSQAPAIGEITHRALGHFVLIGNALDAAGFKAPTSDGGAWDRSIHDAEAHVWIQFQENGQWIDVDSSPGATYGRAFVAPAHVDDGPDTAAFEMVEFAVSVERYRDGKLTIERVLDHQARAADLAGTAIGVYHERSARTATPILLLGDQRVQGSALDAGGAGVGAGITRDLGSLFGGSTAGTLTAEWLDIQATGPAGKEQARYTIVDTIGPAARRDGRPPADPSAAQTRVLDAFDAVLGIAVETGRVPASLPLQLVAEMGDPSTPQPIVHVLTAQNAVYEAIRGAIPSSFFDQAPVSYLDAPSVIVSRTGPGASGGVESTDTMDLTLRPRRTVRLPEDPLRNTGAFYDNIAAGVLDHTLERWLVGRAADTANVGALIERAVDQGIDLRVLRAASDAIPDYLGPDARLRIASAVAAGEVMVLPQTKPNGWSNETGWWDVNASTGCTADTTEGGGHQAGVEEGQQQRANIPAYKKFCELGAQVARGVAAVTLLYALGASGDLGTSGTDALNMVDFICRIANGGRGPKPPPRNNPPVPPPKPNPGGGFPPTGPRFPDVPQAPKSPNVPQWWSNNGGWRKWR